MFKNTFRLETNRLAILALGCARDDMTKSGHYDLWNVIEDVMKEIEYRDANDLGRQWTTYAMFKLQLAKMMRKYS